MVLCRSKTCALLLQILIYNVCYLIGLHIYDTQLLQKRKHIRTVLCLILHSVYVKLSPTSPWHVHVVSVISENQIFTFPLKLMQRLDKKEE